MVPDPKAPDAPLTEGAAMSRRGVTFAAVRKLALALPAVEEGTSYGTPAFRVRGKFRFRLREDGQSLAVKCGFEERDARLRADPRAFFTTDHYRGYPAVVVSLDAVRLTDLREVIEESWRQHAPRRLLRQLDPAVAEPGTATAMPRRADHSATRR
jgi:hypothetical protein